MSKYLERIHFAPAKTQYISLQTGLRFHSRGYELPPHQRVCGTTNSRWLAGDHYTSSDNDPRFGWLNSSSDDLKADAAMTRPLARVSARGARTSHQSQRAGGPAAAGADGLVGGETFSDCHHLSTDDSSHLRASATPTNGGRPSLHRQIPTQVLADRQATTSARRRHAGVRTRQSKNTNAAHVAYGVLDGPPVRTAQQTPEPGSSGRRQRWRPRQSQLSQRARHAGADDACGRPVLRCQSSPLRKVGERLLP
jgi:hypothetical protein